MERNRTPDRRKVEAEYLKLTVTYEELLRRFRMHVLSFFESTVIRPTVKTRVKTFESYYHKLLARLPEANGDKESVRITDVLGMRVVCPFVEDLAAAEHILKQHLSVTEEERKGVEQTFREFGYRSTHLVVRVPPAILKSLSIDPDTVAEIQLNTILQDAWAEVEHELVYKANFTPFDKPMKRKLAAVNATLTLSDIIFQEIRDYQTQLQSQLNMRRSTFLSTVDAQRTGDGMQRSAQRARSTPENGCAPTEEQETISAGPLSSGGFDAAGSRGPSHASRQGDIDRLLLDALYAHNAEDFSLAIALYSRILSLAPAPEVRSIIHVHRGMAYFSQLRYEEAIADFDLAIEHNSRNAKALYYRGIVYDLLGDHAQAGESFDSSLEIDPYQHDPLFARARLRLSRGEHAGALDDCRRALSVFPESREFQELQRQIQKLIEKRG